MDKAKMAAMSGEGNYKGGGAFLTFDEVKLAGTSGVYVMTEFTGQKTEEGYPKTNLGGNLSVIFLKIRRQMFEFQDRVLVFKTNEFDAKTEEVMATDGTFGTEEEYKKKRPEAKTHIIIYAFLPKKDALVRIPVSGSSLYSEDTDRCLRFYNYLQTFKDRHTFEFFAELGSTEEVGRENPYFAMSFARGKELTIKQLEMVSSKMEELEGQMIEQKKNERSPIIGRLAPKTTTGTVAYPQEDIDPDLIPF